MNENRNTKTDKTNAEEGLASACCSPCPSQSECYGEVKDGVTYPFWGIGLGLGSTFSLGVTVGKVTGFSDEYTAIVTFGIATMKIPVELFL